MVRKVPPGMGKLLTPQSASIMEETRENFWWPIPSCTNADLDACREQKYPKGEKGQEMPFPLEAKLPFDRPTLDGEFKSIQLDDNLARKVKIGVNLPPTVENDLIGCLLANTNLFTNVYGLHGLFACSPEEMPGIDPSVTCHKLNVNTEAKLVSQKRLHNLLKRHKPP